MELKKQNVILTFEKSKESIKLTLVTVYFFKFFYDFNVLVLKNKKKINIFQIKNTLKKHSIQQYQTH